MERLLSRLRACARDVTWLRYAPLFPHSGGERGQGLAEYSLILGLIAIVSIVALLGVGSAITGLFWAPISEQFGNVLDIIFGG